jgi:hypothetical protein
MRLALGQLDIPREARASQRLDQPEAGIGLSRVYPESGRMRKGMVVAVPVLAEG